MPSRDGARQEQSFPLSSFFQLITFFVALVVCIDSGDLSDVLSEARRGDVADFLKLALLSGLVGLAIGASIGLGHIRKWRGMLLCGLSGTTVGILMFAVYLAPAQPAQAFSASLVPLVTTILIRFRTP